MRLVNKQLSDLRKVPTADGDSTSGLFKPEELSNALSHLEPGKSLGLGSIFPEFIFHAGSVLISWLYGFLTSCIRQVKIPRISRRTLAVAIPKPNKPLGDPKSYRPMSLLCPLQDPLCSRRTRSNTSIHRSDCRNRRVFDMGGQP